MDEDDNLHDLNRNREPDTWRGEATRDDEPSDPLGGPEYPDSGGSEDRKRSACRQCGTRIAPQRELCSDCEAEEPPRTDPTRGSSSSAVSEMLSKSTAGEDREWSLDRVIAAVVSATEAETAATIGNVAIDKRVKATLENSDGTRVKQIREFDGEPPFPIGRGYDSLPGVVEANSETGQQLLADLARDMELSDDGRPQVYTEYADPVEDWETAEDLQAKYDREDIWIVTAVVRQFVETESSSDSPPTMQKICAGTCARTKHVFTGRDPDPGEPSKMWKCTRCGATQPGHAEEADVEASWEDLDEDTDR